MNGIMDAPKWPHLVLDSSRRTFLSIRTFVLKGSNSATCLYCTYKQYVQAIRCVATYILHIYYNLETSREGRASRWARNEVSPSSVTVVVVAQLLQ